jgi:PAS domain S-box-containing protein
LASYESTREAQRVAEIEYLGAARPEADRVLQEIVDEVCSIYESELCMVTLLLPDVQYLRAWSGNLPEDLAQARQDPRERSMCQYVVESEEPLVVKDCQAIEAFKNQHFYVKYGFRFYAGVPLTTSSGHVIGDLCLLDTRPREFDEGQMRLLAAFPRAVVGRLELLGALRREELAREKEAKRSRELGWALEKYRQAEEELKESEERYRSLVELSPDAIAIQTKGEILYVNEAAVKLHGAASAQELIGRAVSDFIHPDHREVVLERSRRIREKGERVGLIEEKFIRLDGLPVDVEVAAAPISYKGEQAVQVVFRNIIERKQAEEALHQSEERFRSLVQYSSDIITILEADGTIRYESPSIERILGYGPEELIGGNVFDYVYPEDVERVRSIFVEALKNERVTPLVEFRFRHADGSWRYLEAIGNNLLADPSVKGMVVNSRDVTERKELENNQQRFLANAAHQLRTPITAVVGAAELLTTRKDADPALRERLLNHVLSEGNRLRRLAETLLRMARVGQDLRGHKLERVNPLEAVAQAAKLMEPLAQAQGLALRVEAAEEEDGRVLADPEWLQEALLVLLSNAIKHSSQGGSVRLLISGNTITVEDEGDGISEEDLPYVFERFYRGKGTFDGFGLGLSICKELIERMGGSISLRSREEIGTTVEVKLAECS